MCLQMNEFTGTEAIGATRRADIPPNNIYFPFISFKTERNKINKKKNCISNGFLYLQMLSFLLVPCAAFA